MKLTNGPLKKVKVPSVGFHLVVETSEDDGDYPVKNRTFFKHVEEALNDYMLLKDVDALRENDPDKFIDYIGHTNVGIPRDLDSVLLMEVLIQEGVLYEREVTVSLT